VEPFSQNLEKQFGGKREQRTGSDGKQTNVHKQVNALILNKTAEGKIELVKFVIDIICGYNF
jgi:hypothetical protein